MKIHDYLRHTATPARIFVTCLVILIAVTILQAVAVEIHGVLAISRARPAAIQTEDQSSEDQIRTRRIQNASKLFLPDGSIHIVSMPRRTSTEEPEDKIFDANDNLLWQGPRDERPYEYLSWTTGLRSYHQGFWQSRMRQSQIITPGFSQTLEIPVGTPPKITRTWTYHPALDLFIGYDSDGRKIGYAGSTGFTDTKSGTRRFGEFRLFTAWSPPDSQGPTLLWQTPRRIYQIDFDTQQVELVFENPEADIESMSLHAWRDLRPGERQYADPKTYRPLLHCKTEDGTDHLIMRNPDRHLTFKTPEDWQGWVGSFYRFAATKRDILLRRDWIEFPAVPEFYEDKERHDKWFRDYHSQAKTHHVELYRVGSDGSLDLLNRYEWTMPARANSITTRKRPLAERFANQFSPPVYRVAILVLARSLRPKARSGQYVATLSNELVRIMGQRCAEGWGINLALSAAMAGFVFWHAWARRTLLARLVFWLVFVTAFSLAGLLTYIALNHSPVITCPACGRRRGLARVDCAHCRAPLPAPEPGKLDLIFES
ncbi:MAG: hypothetical protein ACYTE3_10665 [Planctomycetota bacterium]|jgi:hypothetical protein